MIKRPPVLRGSFFGADSPAPLGEWIDEAQNDGVFACQASMSISIFSQQQGHFASVSAIRSFLDQKTVSLPFL
jgi:hypothetical protein